MASQIDRMEVKLDKVLEEQKKVSNMLAVHAEKFEVMEAETKLHKARAWSVLFLLAGAVVTLVVDKVRGK